MRALGVALAVAALVGGLLVGRLAASPEPAIGPAVVRASVAEQFTGETSPPSASRQVLVGVSMNDVVADATALLSEAATQRDPAAAAHELLAHYGFDGPSDSCADGSATACPAGAPANLRADPVPMPAAQAVSAEAGRPPTAVFAVTPDLVAVSVAHREGEKVTALSNVISGDEPDCDPVVTGYDRLAHPLPAVESTIDAAVIDGAGWDPAFTSRTTYAFDINEGLLMYLCAQVVPRGGREPNYLARAVVQTADRLVPTVSLAAVTGLALPGWTIEGYLAGGQQCGSVRVPTLRTFTAVTIDLSVPRTLCEATDSLGATPAGRGVLPFSSGDLATLTIAHAYSLGPSEYTSLDLGAPALCTGACTPPSPQAFRVWGSHGTALVIVAWTQGSSNGAPETSVGAVSEDASTDARAPFHPTPIVPRAIVFEVQYRVNTDEYSVGASRTAAYLTVRAGTTSLVGPRAGQCLGDQTGFEGTAARPVVVGDVVHFSGSVQTVSIVPDVIGCVPDWPTSPLAITFAADIPLQEFTDHPEGVVLRVDQPLGADPSVRATASAIVRIRLAQ